MKSPLQTVPAVPTASSDRVLVLFDWNGTLINDVERAWRASASLALAHGRPAPSLHQFQHDWRLPLPLHLADLGLPATANVVEQWNSLMCESSASLQPAARQTLYQLAGAGIAVGIVSAAGESVRADLAEHRLFEIVDIIHTNVADKAAVLRGYRTTYASVHYVGDTEHDMTAASEAGVHAIGFSGGYRPSEALRLAGAEDILHDLTDVPALVGATPTAGRTNTVIAPPNQTPGTPTVSPSDTKQTLASTAAGHRLPTLVEPRTASGSANRESGRKQL